MISKIRGARALVAAVITTADNAQRQFYAIFRESRAK